MQEEEYMSSKQLGRREFMLAAAATGLSASAIASQTRPRLVDHQHRVIYQNEHAYVAWPTILRAKNGDLVIAFNQAMRRPTKMHADPTYLAMLIRSGDEGINWSAPTPIGGYRNNGVESIGAAVLKNGDILGQCYHPRYWTEAEAKKRSLLNKPGVRHWKGYPWYQQCGNFNYVFRSIDHGYTWESPVSFDASPYRMAFMLRSALELADGTLVLPCTDDSFGSGRDFVMFSKDGGRSWANPTPITRDPSLFFSEPALLLLSNGKLIAMLRTHKDGKYSYLHQAESLDGGRTWSDARKTPMWGLPAHMLLLANGNVLCVYGYRRSPFGVRACLSYNQGADWDIENELILRDDFPNGNLGYPTSIQLGDGRILTVYYGEDRSGDPGVQASGLTRIELSSYRIAFT